MNNQTARMITMGKLIVIDGLDGSGKATQTKLVLEELGKLGYNVRMTSFPDYASDSSAAVKMYLSGKLGMDASKLNPYMCSAFYAVDRAIQFTQNLMDFYNKDNSILLCDRYLSANIIHQGCKFSTDEEMQEFFKWDYEFETKYMGIPRDDITIVLDVPVEISQRLMTKRYNGQEEKKDIHEANISYLKSCYHSMEVACNSLPKTGYNWVRIGCANGDNIRGIEDIHKDIMTQIYTIL